MITRDDFTAANWESVLPTKPDRTCRDYILPLGRAGESAAAAGQEQHAAVFRLLARVAGLALRADDDTKPLSIAVIFRDGTRSPSLGDFSGHELALLREVAPSVHDDDFRARLADIGWLAARDHRLAHAAVDAYLASARTLEDHRDWLDCTPRIQRAAALGASLGRDVVAKVVAHVDRILNDSESQTEPSFFASKVLSILRELGQGDSQRLARLANLHASRAADARLWPMAREYWRHASSLYDKLKDAGASRSSRKNIAESYLREAEAGAERGAAIRAHFIGRAIHAFRQVGGEQTRIDELHREMLQYQRQAVAEMKVVEGDTVDLGPDARRAEAAVRGKPFNEAVLELCRFCPPPSVDDLRKAAKEQTERLISKSLFATSLITHEGKVIAEHGPVSRPPREDDDAISSEMYSLAAFQRQLNAIGLIEPARREIWNSQRCSMDDLAPFAVENPFVPPGREFLFVRGLHAGLSGDYGVALHLLMPQVENAMRQVLSQHGVLTSGIDDDGIQDEKDLNKLLYEPKPRASFKDLFGENVLFEARGLLVARFGTNLRNRMAHGLLNPSECYGHQSIYFWWWTLRLVCAPFLITRKPLIASDAATESTAASETAAAMPSAPIAKTREA